VSAGVKGPEREAEHLYLMDRLYWWFC